ncbi:MAG: hypothetical protein V7677_16575, partial [Motiliproteus sp.]
MMADIGRKPQSVWASAPTILFVLALLLSLAGVNYWGSLLKRQAAEDWLDKAAHETQQITDTSLHWLSLFHTQLRGLATGFYGSENITKDEFLDMLEVAEGVEQESVIPLTSLAYAVEQKSENVSAGMFVIYSTDIDGVL